MSSPIDAIVWVLSAKLGRLGVEDFLALFMFFCNHDFDWAFCGGVCVDWVLSEIGG